MSLAMEIRQEAESLAARLRELQHHYYVLNTPLVSDLEYDRLFDRLVALEAEYPELQDENSPSQRLGSDLSSELPEVRHSIPVLSLDKAYAEAELDAWISKLKLQGATRFVIEEKLDGSSLVLYYKDGRLERAVTRGNGLIGNDVSANVRTIGSIPLVLPEPRTGPVRGEVFLRKSDFEKINQDQESAYANPRNFAAGSLRRVKSSEVAKVPLRIFVYESFFEGGADSHWENIEDLKRLGFPVNPRSTLLEGDRVLEDLRDYLRKESSQREGLDYEIDGLVLKVDSILLREQLGYTGHHPRWAIAYKFENPQGMSRVLSIDVQIGRTGRATPVARIEPVAISGTMVSNVTLHNQDYIEALELSIGDEVLVSRRGDVIPAIERVLEKSPSAPPVWHMPPDCPSCASLLERIGAHHFCTNFECPDRLMGRLRFFVGRDQMDIDGLGEESLVLLHVAGFLNDIPDIYTLPYEKIVELPGWGEKKLAQLKQGIEDSLGRPYQLVLPSLGIPDLGPKVCELLVQAGYRDVEQLFELVNSGHTEALLAIKGLGEKTVARIEETFRDPSFRRLVDRLKALGLQFLAEPEEFQEEVGPFKGQVWCVTGSFEHFKPRGKAMEYVKRGGGSVVSDLSSRTTHLLAGSGAGSKLSKAQALKVEVVEEEAFLKILEQGGYSLE